MLRHAYDCLRDGGPHLLTQQEPKRDVRAGAVPQHRVTTFRVEQASGGRLFVDVSDEAAVHPEPAQFLEARGTGTTVNAAAGIRLIYDRDTSELFYDPTGGSAVDRVAFLNTGTRLRAADFVIF